DKMTLGHRNTADTTPAYEIFDRFMERLQQRIQYAEELLKTEQFTFDSDEKIVVNRKDSPYPKDLDEARKLWRERLRYEFLQEKLSKAGAKKKAQAGKAGDKAQSSGDASTEADQQKPKVKAKSESEEIVDTLTRRYSRNFKAFTEWDG